MQWAPEWTREEGYIPELGGKSTQTSLKLSAIFSVTMSHPIFPAYVFFSCAPQLNHLINYDLTNYSLGTGLLQEAFRSRELRERAKKCQHFVESPTRVLPICRFRHSHRLTSSLLNLGRKRPNCLIGSAPKCQFYFGLKKSNTAQRRNTIPKVHTLTQVLDILG